ncbi:MAG: rane protein [Pseudonocardiales bacterium]|nr:rane protein [Pseudonocardiales bacterium]
MRSILRWPAAVSGGGLIVGYAVAALTTRPLGGVVLLVAGIAAFALWLRAAGARTATQLGVLYIALFVVSHLLALVIGAWPSVLAVAVIMAAASWWLVDSRSEDPAPVS